MKIKSFVFVMFLLGTTIFSSAQRVRIRLNFPVGININPSGPGVHGRVWIGPEWEWRGDRYECVPGYWAEPRRRGAIWVSGHWKATRFGYKWVPGHWR